MSFKSTAVKHVKDDQYVVEGKMTVKDVSESVAVPFTFLGVTTIRLIKNPTWLVFEARMTADRLAYNVGGGKFFGMSVVGKDVDVLITLEVIRKK